jgi:exopolysaccharide biosynthesis polyprenyl glycosylphosphotransferase
VALDLLAIAAATASAAFLRFEVGFLEVTELTEISARAHWTAALVWVVALLFAMTANRLYDPDTLFAGGGEMARVFRSVLEAAAVIPIFVFLTQSFYVSRSWFGMTVVLSLGLVASQRLVLRTWLYRARRAGRHARPVILVSSDDGDETWFVDPTGEFKVVDTVDAQGLEDLVLEAAHRLHSRDTVVVLRARDFSHEDFWRVLVAAGEMGWSTFVHSPVRSVGRDRLTLRDLAGFTVVRVAPPTLTGYRAAAKRLFDISIAAPLSILLVPLYVVIAVAVFVSSGRPVIYRQERTGLRGRTFVMLKFRTMRTDSESQGPTRTTKDDPRRTRIGRFLRRASLDELPQLWNVLKGDMSLVGPRPEHLPFATEFTERFAWYGFRHRIKPGLTGWAQAHGLRGDTSLEDRINFDNWYIENWSIWLDLKIMLLTIREVARGDNAY